MITPKGDQPVAPTPVNGPRARSWESFIAGHKPAVTARINHTKRVGATGGSPVVGAEQSIRRRNYRPDIGRAVFMLASGASPWYHVSDIRRALLRGRFIRWETRRGRLHGV